MTSHALSEVLIIVIPIAVALLALAVAWGTVQTRQKNMAEDISELKEDGSEYLKEKDHILLCINNTLRFEKHVTKEIKKMGDTLLEEMTTLINGGK